jgi:hypothetical protein
MNHKGKARGEVPSKGKTEKRKSCQAIVQCEHYRCIGVQQVDGSWVDLHGEPLAVREVVSWIGEC